MPEVSGDWDDTMRDRKEYIRAYQKKWIADRRNKWIQENGPCKICGSSENLEIDHINPEEKEFFPRELWSRNEETRKKELAKCQVLCKKCHKEKSKEDCRKMFSGKPIPSLRTVSKETIRNILIEILVKGRPQRKVAEEFGITRGLIGSVLYQGTWFDVMSEFKKEFPECSRVADK